MKPLTVALIFTVALFTLFVTAVLMLTRAKPYCPRCKKGVRPDTIDKNGVATHMCPDCGHELKF